MKITVRLTPKQQELLDSLSGRTQSDRVRTAIRLAHLYQKEKKAVRNGEQRETGEATS